METMFIQAMRRRSYVARQHQSATTFSSRIVPSCTDGLRKHSHAIGQFHLAGRAVGAQPNSDAVSELGGMIIIDSYSHPRILPVSAFNPSTALDGGDRKRTKHLNHRCSNMDALPPLRRTPLKPPGIAAALPGIGMALLW